MKKIILIMTIALAAASCKWLSITPDNTIDADDLFATGYGCRDALNGIYLNMGSYNFYGKNLSWGFLSAASQQYVTNPDKVSVMPQETIDAADLQYNTVNMESVVENIWKSGYSLIANINKLLDNIDAVDPHTFAYEEDEKALIKAEALALRAYIHFDLLRLFAPAPATSPAGNYIPYREKYSSEVAGGITVQAFLEKVIKDISAAEPVLRKFDTETHPAAMYNSNMFDIDSHWCAIYRFASGIQVDAMGLFFWYRGFRMNYLALLGLKTRVCLYAGQKYHSLANAAAQELYDKWYNQKGWIGFTPEANLNCAQAMRFSKACDDVLFGAYNKNLATDYDSQLYDSNNSVRLPLANVQSLFASDNTGLYSDNRFRYQIALTNEANSKYYSLKYGVSADGTVAAMENQTIPLIRFSEVCYALAEIAAEKNNLSAATEYLSTVRTARGAMRDVSLSVTDYDSLMEEIVLDARKEFVGEGELFFLYKRLNIEKVPSSMDNDSDRTMTGGYVLPIPVSENPF